MNKYLRYVVFRGFIGVRFFKHISQNKKDKKYWSQGSKKLLEEQGPEELMIVNSGKKEAVRKLHYQELIYNQCIFEN